MEGREKGWKMRERFPGMLHPLMQSLKWAFAQAPDTSAVQHNLPLRWHGSIPCLGHPSGKKQPAHHPEAGTEVRAHQLLFLAPPHRRCGLQHASSWAPSLTLTSAKPALPNPCQNRPAAVRVSCPCCHKHCAINPCVLVCLHPQRG